MHNIRFAESECNWVRIRVTADLLRRCLPVVHLRQRAHLPEEDVQSNTQTDNSPGQQRQQ